VIAGCPVCLAAIVAATATSGGGLWALARIAKEEDIGMKKNSKTEKHKVGMREEWLADELALMRQELPWVRVDKVVFRRCTGLAGVSGIPTRNRRTGEKAEAVGSAEARKPETDLLGLWAEAGRCL
jgi:hypothetical protein